MAKPNLGNKQVCPNCETRYFDLGQLPPTCPKCATVVEVVKGKAKSKAVVEPEPVVAKAPVAEDEVDLEIDLEVDDDLDEDLDDDDDEDDDLIEDTSDLGDDDDVAAVIPRAGGGEDEA